VVQHNPSREREKKHDMRHFQSDIYTFLQIISATKSGQYFLHFQVSIFCHMRTSTTHILSKSEKGELLPSCTITDSVQRPTVSTLIIRDSWNPLQ